MALNLNIFVLDAFVFKFIHVTDHIDVNMQLNSPQSFKTIRDA